uniref:Uncharacterized protein n=1 Tax=Lactuca sativa TaxID=4236 RepID=A0A9R1UE43_LACSA|nr:hypothetical protein LSAT_V11C900490070 [Lactuca sativa]
MRARIAKDFSSDFYLYLLEGIRNEIGLQYFYCYSVEDDPKNFEDAMVFQDVMIWKEAIDDESHQFWKISHECCLIFLRLLIPLGCEWIF